MSSQPVPTPRPATRREQAKAARRVEILSAAARQMAQRGYNGVRLEDIGAEVGISGPAMYRHFQSKSELLDTILIDISERLHDGGVAAAAEGGTPVEVLERLIEFHIDVLVTRPDLISVQDRDLWSLSPQARHRVRSLQRRYVEVWVRVLMDHAIDRGVELEAVEARVRIHAMFGLLNSSPRLPEFPRDRLRGLLTGMAMGALQG
ncbi:MULTISPECIES: TetR/AcrR family transcriptional regulator [Gordonia]|uniref:Helix-turn-helix domain-containing protein n=2 Tax=Gordonia TaxID=2053 RepID=A0ABN3H055_9ACTN|nr:MULTISPECIES: TetR/AcrR family transcriptional regulator [Gordonia]AUH69844.1 TetR/AcrR family transcriptional regulator [Gordonia sp. YC-JH1]KJR05960.1 TetR family transcriptional regulator [Gordonia sihwensis]MBY4571588.1 TetR family transcriptional regulator [Gordonia sihwensis]WFN93559.1 TetR/AcrR family transcriptional regulator [Gordonia sihwensis]GAC59438.1 putative TetR family transcriptional regulator [Gordonia sihwensis NBRC 108236]